MLPRNLASRRAQYLTCINSSTDSWVDSNNTSSQDTKGAASKSDDYDDENDKEIEDEEEWEDGDQTNEKDEFDEDEADNDAESVAKASPLERTFSKRSVEDRTRFGEKAKSKKKGSELGGSIDVNVALDFKLIKALIVSVISKGMHDGGSLLVFMPGVGEISKLCDLLNNKSSFYNNRQNSSWEESNKDDKDEFGAALNVNGQKLMVLPLHSGLSGKDQMAVFKSAPRGSVKVVVATNIAETSITIPDCTVVIDSARVKLVFIFLHL